MIKITFHIGIIILTFSAWQGPVALADDNRAPLALIVESADFQSKMDKLNESAESWKTLRRSEKLAAISLVIELFKQRENTAILESKDFYLQRVDDNLTADRSMAQLPFPIVIKAIAVMEYDFYNGQDKEALAREVLGEELYERNKTRRRALRLT